MTVDHHGGTAGVATLLVRAMGEILGTHRLVASRFLLDGVSDRVAEHGALAPLAGGCGRLACLGAGARAEHRPEGGRVF
jgi:hypothetical protein